jgi:hypothetical protein
MTDPQPKLHRFGKRTLMRLGAIQPEGAKGVNGVTEVWRDVTEQVTFANAKYKQPHQGTQEKARRLRQAQEEGQVMAIVMVGATGAVLMALAAISLGLLLRLWEL